MNIENIHVKANGSVHCRSRFYSAFDHLDGDANYIFTTGVNKLVGEIDGGNWAVSYYLAMHNYRPKDFVLFTKTEVSVNGKMIPLQSIEKYICYMDEEVFPLFSSKKSIKKLITQGIKKNKSECTSEEIRKLFYLDDKRFQRPIQCVGNERFRAMATEGYAHGKQIFCFPWLSQNRFAYYHGNITYLLDILEKLKVIAIVPMGR